MPVGYLLPRFVPHRYQGDTGIKAAATTGLFDVNNLDVGIGVQPLVNLTFQDIFGLRPAAKIEGISLDFEDLGFHRSSITVLISMVSAIKLFAALILSVNGKFLKCFDDAGFLK